MINAILQVQALLTSIKNLGFFSRLFFWGRVQRNLSDAAATLAVLQHQLTALEQSHSQANLQLSVLQENKRSLEKQLQSLQANDVLHTERNRNYELQLQSLKGENNQLKKEEEFRSKKFSEEIFALQQIKWQVTEERQKEAEEKHQQEISKLKALKETWAAHQADVQMKMKAICQKHTFQYVDKTPFKGEPDNAILVCDEHIIFDAKSPAGEELRNFPSYIKAQAEAARKYAKLEGVHKAIFLVVPANTLSVLQQFVYNMADYDVFVVSAEVLEPLIVSLYKIEDYEFAEQLSPEDRENICRIIGKFSHLSKRRMQIDAFFSRQFLELAAKCDQAIPSDMQQKVKEFERAEKLNPPQEKRAKAIDLPELQREQLHLEANMNLHGITLSNEAVVDALANNHLYK